ncbi:MAG: GerMN domain-containing protein [Nitrospirales bacterium]|nr:GerMN domain-containing protein [Nitrospirales bacterium]
MRPGRLERGGGKKGMRRKIIFSIIIFLFVSLSLVMILLYWGGDLKRLFFLEEAQDAPEPVALPRDAGGAGIILTLPSAGGLVSKEVSVGEHLAPLAQAETVVSEYLKALPVGLREAKVLGLYKDRANVLYLDISGEISSRFSGDARDEYLIMRSLWLTVSQNLPWVTDLRILIDGKEKESLGGHLSALNRLRNTVGAGE